MQQRQSLTLQTLNLIELSTTLEKFCNILRAQPLSTYARYDILFGKWPSTRLNTEAIMSILEVQTYSEYFNFYNNLRGYRFPFSDFRQARQSRFIFNLKLNNVLDHKENIFIPFKREL